VATAGAPEPPQNIVQASGRVAESIVGGLVHTPTLLLIVLLNLSMIFAAAYYLDRQEAHRINTANRITDLLSLCIVGYRDRVKPPLSSTPDFDP
jgi:hypothetical protein